MASDSLPQHTSFTLPVNTDFSEGFTLYDKEILALGTILSRLNFILLHFHRCISTLPEFEDIRNELLRAAHDLEYVKGKLGIPK